MVDVVHELVDDDQSEMHIWPSANFCGFGLEHGCANHATEGETLQSPIHCCDVTMPPYLFSGEL